MALLGQPAAVRELRSLQATRGVQVVGDGQNPHTAKHALPLARGTEFARLGKGSAALPDPIQGIDAPPTGRVGPTGSNAGRYVCRDARIASEDDAYTGWQASAGGKRR